MNSFTNKTLLFPSTPKAIKKENGEKKLDAFIPSPIPDAALPLCAQRLDHSREEPPVLGRDLRDVLRATDVGVLHGLGEGRAARAVAQGAGEVAAVARRHGSSRTLCLGDRHRRHGDLRERHGGESPVPRTTQLPLLPSLQPRGGQQHPGAPTTTGFTQLLSPLTGFARLLYHKIKDPCVPLT